MRGHEEVASLFVAGQDELLGVQMHWNVSHLRLPHAQTLQRFRMQFLQRDAMTSAAVTSDMCMKIGGSQTRGVASKQSLGPSYFQPLKLVQANPSGNVLCISGTQRSLVGVARLESTAAKSHFHSRLALFIFPHTHLRRKPVVVRVLVVTQDGRSHAEAEVAAYLMLESYRAKQTKAISQARKPEVRELSEKTLTCLWLTQDERCVATGVEHSVVRDCRTRPPLPAVVLARRLQQLGVLGRRCRQQRHLVAGVEY